MPIDSTHRPSRVRSLGRRAAVERDDSSTLSAEFSANRPLVFWQRWALITVTLALCLGLFSFPRTTLSILLAVFALPFLCVVVLRFSALVFLLTSRRTLCDAPPLADDVLPSYSILVPLYEEAEIVPDLIAALQALDYPRDKLDIQLIVESADPKTYAAVFEAELADHMRVNVVATSPPQTKPHALNHALKSARGEIVVVYDAEDMPDTYQLRQAAAILATNERVGCVQSCLNIYNPRESFLTRQFTIEYTALFDCLLPTLRRLGFPVPLGGTSNHFPRHVLNEVGGWDAYNVTEDADLGICLARANYHVEILRSTTWEEAPATFAIWLRQRTRWLKGWIQTNTIKESTNNLNKIKTLIRSELYRVYQNYVMCVPIRVPISGELIKFQGPGTLTLEF